MLLKLSLSTLNLEIKVASLFIAEVSSDRLRYKSINCSAKKISQILIILMQHPMFYILSRIVTLATVGF